MTDDTENTELLPDITSEHTGTALGPAMRDLTDKQRRFVIAMCETGGANYAKSARMAGYQGNDNVMRVQGHRLAHDEKILRALREEADRRVRSGALLGASVLIEIANDPLHKDRFKAADRLLERAGLLVVQTNKTIHEHTVNDEDVKLKIMAACKELGLDPRKFLGDAVPGALPAPIDAEFTVVDPNVPLKVEPATFDLDFLTPMPAEENAT